MQASCSTQKISKLPRKKIQPLSGYLSKSTKQATSNTLTLSITTQQRSYIQNTIFDTMNP